MKKLILIFILLSNICYAQSTSFPNFEYSVMTICNDSPKIWYSWSEETPQEKRYRITHNTAYSYYEPVYGTSDSVKITVSWPMTDDEWRLRNLYLAVDSIKSLQDSLEIYRKKLKNK